MSSAGNPASVSPDPFARLDDRGADYRRLDLSEVPKSAADVERIYGSPRSHVLKTLLFVGARPVVAVVPGDRDVDEPRIAATAGVEADDLRLASPAEVEQRTGTPVGSLSPFVRPDGSVAVLDAGVEGLGTVNMGGGEPGVGIEMDAAELLAVWDGDVAPIGV